MEMSEKEEQMRQKKLKKKKGKSDMQAMMSDTAGF